MDQRIAPLRLLSYAILAVALVAMIPWMGWWPLLALAVSAIPFAVGRRAATSVAHPEWVLFGVWATSEAVITACVAGTGGVESPALAWPVLPVVTLSARFSVRGTVFGVGIALLLLLGATLGAHPAATLANPAPLIATVALLIAVAILSAALMRSDIEHREEAVLDPLTQLLNRKALEQRAAELGEQSALRSDPIGVVIGDIDHFKAVNDTLGHAAGDAVLKDVAYLLRKQLRAFDLVYRMGGEEFLVLLPGADADRASDVAERLRAAIAEDALGGEHITMSFGVAATEPGERFDLYDVAGAADRALYCAKADGRDRVRTEDPRLPVGTFG